MPLAACMPSMPMKSGSAGGMAPRAMRVHTAGAERRWAREQASSAAPEEITPPPRYRTGRRAAKAGGRVPDLASVHAPRRPRGRVPAAAHVDLLRLNVLGHVDDDGAGPSGLGHLEGQRHRLQQFGCGSHEEIVLGDRQGEAVGVDLLKGVGPDEASAKPGRLWRPGAPNRAGHRRSPSRGWSRRARGGKADGGAARRPGHALGDEARPLLMAGEDVADRAAVQRVVERQDGPAGYSRDRPDALPFEQGAQ